MSVLWLQRSIKVHTTVEELLICVFSFSQNLMSNYCRLVHFSDETEKVIWSKIDLLPASISIGLRTDVELNLKGLLVEGRVHEGTEVVCQKI